MSSTSKQALCRVSGLRHAYGNTVAVDGIDLSVKQGEIVAVLGRNGSGKTTLFRIIGTLLPVQEGNVEVDGVNVATDVQTARSRIGIIFQSPSLDNQLTVLENLKCQGALYGLHGDELKDRIENNLAKFSLADRRNDRCQTLSGGLKRRVELAKGLLHQPKVMLLDEPSTGLDPAARLALWDTLRSLAKEGVAVLLTTHLMEEAAKASRVVLLDTGKKIADDKPSVLCGELGGDVLNIVADNLALAQSSLADQLKIETQVVGDSLRGTCTTPEQIADVVRLLGDQVQSISVGRPSLEDVFVARTGHAFNVVPNDLD